MTAALIDGDVICYRAAFGAQRKEHTVFTDEGQAIAQFNDVRLARKLVKEFTEENPDALLSIESEEILEHEDVAIGAAENIIKNCLRAADTENHEVWLSPSTNFRNDIYPQYKANRKDLEKPVYYAAVKHFLVAEHRAEIADGVEADDALTMAHALIKRSVLCSVDKDLLQSPGKHYDFVKDKKQTVTRKEAGLLLHCQTLAGDSVDNIPGVKGWGLTKAKKLLEPLSFSERFAVIEDKYKGEYGGSWEEAINLNFKCVYMLRCEEDISLTWEAYKERVL